MVDGLVSPWEVNTKFFTNSTDLSRALLLISAEKELYEQDFPLTGSVGHSRVHVCFLLYKFIYLFIFG